jgi:hypothetical protein
MRLRRLFFALAIVAGSTAIAGAAGLSGMGAYIYGNYFKFPKANLEKAPVKTIKVGKVNVSLQTTRLVDLRKAFGGTIQSAGGATWLCYHTDDANTWFISNALGGQEFVMMVAVQAASGAAPGDCVDAPAKFAVPDYGVPSLGAKSSDLKEFFGIAPGSGGKVQYRADAPGGYSDNAQYLGYMMKGSVVAGLGVGESSIPTIH